MQRKCDKIIEQQNCIPKANKTEANKGQIMKVKKFSESSRCKS